MVAAHVALSILLAALLCYAAARKLSHRPEVVASYARVGVPEDRLNLLAGLLLMGAAGLVLGLFRPRIGLAASTALAGYFLVAIGAHIRAGDTANMATPVVMEVLAVAVAGLAALAG